MVVATPVVVAKVFDTTIPTGTNITPIGALGYIETLADRTIIYLDRYTYISMVNEGEESHIDLFTRQESKRLI